MARQVRFPAKILMVVGLLAMCGCMRDDDQRRMKVYNAANLHLNMQDGLLLNDNKPFTGVIYELKANQKDTMDIICFYRGKEHGTWKRFYPNGKLMEKRQYDNGKKVGQLLAWWPNGRRKLDYNFKDGEYSGLCREWLYTGQLMSAMNYDNGYEAGRQVQYYTDGKIKANYTILNGRRYGLLGTKNCKNVADSVFKK